MRGAVPSLGLSLGRGAVCAAWRGPSVLTRPARPPALGGRPSRGVLELWVGIAAGTDTCVSVCVVVAVTVGDRGSIPPVRYTQPTSAAVCSVSFTFYNSGPGVA